MNRCLVKKLIFFSVFISIQLSAQKSEIDATSLSNYYEAKNLFNNKAYAAAQLKFTLFTKATASNSNLKADANYYDAMCAIKLNQENADEKVLQFVKNYPNSNKKNTAFFNTGNYYFANKKAAYALKWYQKVEKKMLSKEDAKELDFKTAYALLTTQNLDLAKKKFLPLINDAKYGNDSRYYYGYIAYKQEDYDLAEETLQEIADKKSYENEISYYLLDISFQGGKFERCIVVGKKLLEEARVKEESEISKIVGESYFNLKKYKESIPYLKAFSGDKGKWSNTDYYQLGYAYFKQEEYDKAIDYFNKIIDQKDEIAQNAYYNLGECYLQEDKKAEALNAFKSASEMNFSERIKEDAALNYAKLSYEEGNPFRNVSDILQEYLKAYPKSKSYTLINELLVTSFLHQQNYQGALDFLRQKKTNENSELSREVSLYRGIQLFNENKLSASLPHFLEAEKSVVKEIKAKATYWNAETNFQLENYKAALEKFIRFKQMMAAKDIEEFSLVDYHIGYCYFKRKDYENAATSFQVFIENHLTEGDVKDDAIIRLGDSEFATKNYQQAIKSYQKIVNNDGSGADYAQYQIAMSAGFLGNNNTKVEGLNAVITTYEISSLKDDALFQLATTYTLLKENNKAHEAYSRLVEKHPQSIFIPKALVRQGLLFYNENKNEKALANFKEIVKKYPNTTDALEAVSNARNIYIDNGNIDEYVAWIKNLKFINIENSEIDDTQFASAEKQYLEGENKALMISSLSNYLQKFPTGMHALKATFYLAQTHYRMENEEAIALYKKVIDQGQSDYSEESLSKLSQLYLAKENYKDAIPLLDRLEAEAYSQENVRYAESNLMQSYYQLASFDLAIQYAKKVLLRDKLDVSIENDAKIIIARAAIKSRDIRTAETYYAQVEQNAVGVLKAEALYYNAFFKNQKKEFEASNEIVQKVIAEYSSYKYWGVKSYVLMAKNYYALKDVYQATFVLENIIKNFKQFEDIVLEAQSELAEIKNNEAKTNNSVTPKN